MDLEIKPRAISERRGVLTLVGRLSAVSAPDLKRLLKESVEAGRVELILDLGAVTLIDSSGLAALVSGLKSARERGGWLRLAGVNDSVALIFRITMLERVFELYPNVGAAENAQA